MYLRRLQESEGPGLARQLLSWQPVLVVLALLFLLLKVGKRYRLMKNREGPNVMSIDESYKTIWPENFPSNLKTNDIKQSLPFSKHLDKKIRQTNMTLRARSVQSK